MTHHLAIATYGLTPVQEKVIAAITGGATLKAAADAASIHRNPIANWNKTSAAFRDALTRAQYDKAIFIREEAETQVADAFAAIHAILTNPDASDGARLNAAKYIIEKASTPPPPEPDGTCRIQAVPESPEIMHSDAQIGCESPDPSVDSAPEKPEIVPIRAQSTAPQPVRSAPKVGRNEPCPCGSHLKFKRCCLGKSPAALAA